MGGPKEAASSPPNNGSIAGTNRTLVHPRAYPRWVRSEKGNGIQTRKLEEENKEEKRRGEKSRSDSYERTIRVQRMHERGRQTVLSSRRGAD